MSVAPSYPFALIANFLTLTQLEFFLKEAHLHESQARKIHGENRAMFKTITNQKLFKKMQSEIHSLLPHIHRALAKIHLFSSRCKAFRYLHDCSFLYAYPEAQAQVWHMDSLQKFLVVNILLSSHKSTEFLALNYVEAKKLEETKSINAFFSSEELQLDYPVEWASPTNGKDIFYKTECAPGDAIAFWSNTIHRGPNTLQESHTRVSLYLTFSEHQAVNSQATITTDYAFPNWAWLDAQFDDNFGDLKIDVFFGSPNVKKKHQHCPFQLDFLKQNKFLLKNLYPEIWFERKVRFDLETELEYRRKTLENFPDSLNLWDVYWPQDAQYYLAKMISLSDSGVELLYLASHTSPITTFESMTIKEWNKTLKTKITLQNIATLRIGGFEAETPTAWHFCSFFPSKKTIQKEASSCKNKNNNSRYILPFSHRLLFCYNVMFPFVCIDTQSSRTHSKITEITLS